MTPDRQPAKNESELLFEAHLQASGLRDYAFERQMPGTTRRPDYALPWANSFILFEVKEFRATSEDLQSGFGAYEPYGPLREKLNAASRKFKDLDEYCCCLVLYNVDKPLIHLEWEYIYGAMLGNLGWSVPIDVPGLPEPEDRETRTIFMAGGKMHRERHGAPIAPQNQTISAIIVLQQFPIGERRFRAEIRSRERDAGRSLEIEELCREMERAEGTERAHSLRQLRVVVHENPYARIELPPELFRGPFDERYGGRDGRIQLVYQGDEIGKLPKVD